MDNTSNVTMIHGIFTKKIGWIVLFIVLCGLMSASPTLAKTPSGKDKAMYVWNAEDVINTADGRTHLINFALQKGINVIYVMTGNYLVTNPYKYEMLNLEAGKQSIKVYALDGEPSWGENPGVALSRMQNIYDYNNRVTSDKKFDGIQFDIEPYLLTQWKDTIARGNIIKNYLNLIKNLNEKANLQTPKIPFAVAIPFWWDGTDYANITYDGISKKLAYHVIDAVGEGVVIMAYRDVADPLGNNSIVGVSKDEVNYAQSVGKHCIIAIETKPLTETYTTFFGETETKMNTELATVDSYYANTLHYRLGYNGEAIHDYKYFQEMTP
ncbi:hypothetical protein [Bacillus bingmayongensis]|uniref:hypothetical protein n=1 Tax=Bacillus bingmayongensis TaxID=1150157 RepID=UPI001C8EC7F3|nr:hypothetical protein [Bacillus bingmayongensis]MBY0600464.1 hypothetical protein [Bacillus bingmayongensis]